MKKIIVLFVIFAIVFLILYREKNTVCFEDRCFVVELAKTQEELEKGLMFRESLDVEEGMLFIFEKEDKYPFWMKNTLLPLDIIWLNKDKEVIFIKEDAQPCQKEECDNFFPGEEAKYVLEINSGLVEEMGLELGDELRFDL